MVEKCADVVLKYTHPAMPPKEISLTAVYSYGKDINGTYIATNGTKIYKDMNFIKTYFSPLKCGWDVLLKK